MADQGEQVSTSCGRRKPSQAVAVAQPPLPPSPQNQEEPANPNPGQNAAGKEVTLEVCSAFLFCHFQHVFLNIVSPLQF